MRVFACMCLCSAALLTAADERSFNTWSEYLGGADSSQYTSLKQVNRNSVKQLAVAWTFPAGSGNRTFNPIIANGVMYVIAKDANTIVALDAATGKELWAHTVTAPGRGGPRRLRHRRLAASIIGRARTSPTGVCCSLRAALSMPSTPRPAR